MNKKKWYDYLWIFSTVYLLLGFVNILFAWLGLICFITPLLISIIKGNKAYCNKYCGRGQLFSLLGGRLNYHGTGPIMGHSFHPVLHSSHSAFTASCLPQQYSDLLPWCYSSHVHGAYTVPWEP